MQLRERQPRRTCATGGQVSLGMLSKKNADCTCMRVQVSSNIWHLKSHPDLIHNAGKGRWCLPLPPIFSIFCAKRCVQLKMVKKPKTILNQGEAFLEGTNWWHEWFEAPSDLTLPASHKMMCRYGWMRVFRRKDVCSLSPLWKASSICVKPQRNQNTKHVKHQGQ